jgi:hypothetical protein
LRNLKRREIALMIVGVLIGAIMLSPASAHVGGTPGHLWTKHLKPLAKQLFYTKTQSNGRYYTKTQSNSRFDARKAATGKTETGVYSFVGTDGTGFTGTTIAFDQMLPTPIAEGNAHYVTSPTLACPGPGQAAAGHLCVYEEFLGGSSFFDIFSPTDSSTTAEDAARQGAMIVFQISAATPNGRGTWAVRPAAPGTTSVGIDASPEARPGFGD